MGAGFEDVMADEREKRSNDAKTALQERLDERGEVGSRKLQAVKNEDGRTAVTLVRVRVVVYDVELETRKKKEKVGEEEN